MKILITTGIYPPTIGGPAQYAKNLATAFTELGHQVMVKTYRLENKLPTGLRHLYFLLKILPAVSQSDFVLALDTFSVGLPTVAAGRLLGKKVIIRTGGDFLWEGYVERTADLVLLRNFYQTTRDRWSLKERLIFALTRWTLQHVSKLVFSTDWQRQIWLNPYQLALARTTIIENCYGPKQVSRSATQKIFVASSRSLKLKNHERLLAAFKLAQQRVPDLVLVDESLPYTELLDNIKTSYAVIIVSVSEVSPNLALEALNYNKPLILTRECGLSGLLKNTVLLVDPLDVHGITEKILFLTRPDNYQQYQQRSERFIKLHGWQAIAEELLALA